MPYTYGYLFSLLPSYKLLWGRNLTNLIRKFGFYVAVFVFSSLICVYPINGIQYLINGHTQAPLNLLIETLIVTIFVIYYLRSTSTFYPLKLLVYQGIGLGFISFWVVSMAIIFNILSPTNSKIIGYASIVIIILLFFVSYFTTRFFVIKEVILKSNKIDKDYCLVFVSDIHLGSNDQNHLRRLISKVQEIKPEALLIGGDLLDSTSFQIEELNLFNDLNIPIYFITGNHEYYLKDSDKRLAALQNYKIITLDNISVVFKNLNIIGISDNIYHENKVKHVKSLVKKELFNICLIHQPSIWDEVSDDVDIMLSGHTHKGQIFPFYFLVKLKFKYIYGIYQSSKSTLCVSSGAGTWGPKMRLGSFNEVIKLNLYMK
jgi:predicted MPP superfamily phosphohydrolase